jgi:hypothetical protein
MVAEAKTSIVHSMVHGKQVGKQNDLAENKNELNALVDQAVPELDATGATEVTKKSQREEPPLKDPPYSDLCVICAVN